MTEQDLPPDVAEALEHLRAAASEMIAAARKMLDAADALVADPSKGAAIVQLAAAFGRAVTDIGSTATGSAERDEYEELDLG